MHQHDDFVCDMHCVPGVFTGPLQQALGSPSHSNNSHASTQQVVEVRNVCVRSAVACNSLRTVILSHRATPTSLRGLGLNIYFLYTACSVYSNFELVPLDIILVE